MKAFWNGFEKKALFGVLRPEFIEGHNPSKDTRGIVATVRHNFRKKHVFGMVDEDMKPIGEFHSWGRGGPDIFSKRTNRKLMEDPKFVEAHKQYKKGK